MIFYRLLNGHLIPPGTCFLNDFPACARIMEGIFKDAPNGSKNIRKNDNFLMFEWFSGVIFPLVRA